MPNFLHMTKRYNLCQIYYRPKNIDINLCQNNKIFAILTKRLNLFLRIVKLEEATNELPLQIFVNGYVVRMRLFLPAKADG